MKRIFIFGECMVELVSINAGSMNQSFAGDVYNTAVYLKRAFPNSQVHLITSVGVDELSEQMLQRFKDESLDTSMVYQCDKKMPGLYAIQTDETGERSFAYWRSDSAARQVMRFIDNESYQHLGEGDMLFFSGISIAVINPDHLGAFWNMVVQLKFRGVQIVFDPNYREKLWETPKQAQEQFELAFNIANIVLPGVGDFEQLYNLSGADQVRDFFKPFLLKELIIKNGEQSVTCVIEGKIYEYKNAPVEKVIDTTSAGDSFNGIYLGARAAGLCPQTSVEMASKAAAFVIRHPGAIVAREKFTRFVQQEFSQYLKAGNC